MCGLGGSAKAADVICYNCPQQWADFASMLKAVKTDLGYDIPFDNKNSGQALSQIIAVLRTTCGLKIASVMRNEHSGKYTPRPPLCPSCAQIMRLARTTSRFGNLPELYTFECRACGLSHIDTA
jgi:hypothetical protein